MKMMTTGITPQNHFKHQHSAKHFMHNQLRASFLSTGDRTNLCEELSDVGAVFGGRLNIKQLVLRCKLRRFLWSHITRRKTT